MTGSQDVPRLTSAESGSSEELRELLGSARFDDPEARQIEALSERMRPWLDGPGPGGEPPDGGAAPPGGAGPGTATAAAGAAGGGQLASLLVRHKLIVAGVVGLVGLSGVHVWRVQSESVSTSAALAASAHHGERFARMRLPVAPVPASATDDNRDPSAASPSLAPRHPREAHAPPETTETEGGLLRRAHAALRSGQAAQALALTVQHRRLFPGGVLSQEREVIAVESLVRMGRRGEAESRANRFISRFPKSAHVRRLRRILGKPADEPGGTITLDEEKNDEGS